MIFNSILFRNKAISMKRGHVEDDVSPFFVDLNLDQIVNAIVVGKNEYYLTPYFYTPLADIASIVYRQDVMRDIEDRSLYDHLQLFATQMRELSTLFRHGHCLTLDFKPSTCFQHSAFNFLDSCFLFIPSINRW